MSGFTAGGSKANKLYAYLGDRKENPSKNLHAFSNPSTLVHVHTGCSHLKSFTVMHLQAAAIGATLLLRGEKVNVGGRKKENEESMSKSLLIYRLMLKKKR